VSAVIDSMIGGNHDWQHHANCWHTINWNYFLGNPAKASNRNLRWTNDWRT
jgi:hypothetical protein